MAGSLGLFRRQALATHAQTGPALARAQVRSALCDDLNMPQVVSALSAPLKALNDLLHTKKVLCARAPPRACPAAWACGSHKGEGEIESGTLQGAKVPQAAQAALCGAAVKRP